MPTTITSAVLLVVPIEHHQDTITTTISTTPVRMFSLEAAFEAAVHLAHHRPDRVAAILRRAPSGWEVLHIVGSGRYNPAIIIPAAIDRAEDWEQEPFMALQEAE